MEPSAACLSSALMASLPSSEADETMLDMAPAPSDQMGNALSPTDAITSPLQKSPNSARSLVASQTGQYNVGSPLQSPVPKYVSPHRRSVSSMPASPSAAHKRPLSHSPSALHLSAPSPSPAWRNNTVFQEHSYHEEISHDSSPTHLSPPHKVRVPHWPYAASTDTGRPSFPSPPRDCSTVGMDISSTIPLVAEVPTPSDSPVATPICRRLFRTVCLASPQQVVFEGARVRHAKISAATLLPAFQDYSDRGIILSFTNRAPSFDHFNTWITANMAHAGITIDGASQLGNDFFLLLLQDRNHQQSALKQKLFFMNKYVDSFAWTPAFSTQSISNCTRPIWVELTNLNSSLRLRSTVEAVVEQHLGPILHFPETGTLVHHTNPRVLVRWNMDEDPADFLSLDDNDDTLLQKVTFLNHPDCCYRCKRTDHALVDCKFPAHFPHDAKSRYSPPLARRSVAGSPPPEDSPRPASEAAPIPTCGLDSTRESLPAHATEQVYGDVSTGIPSFSNPGGGVLDTRDQAGGTLEYTSDLQLPVHLRVRTSTPVRTVSGVDLPALGVDVLVAPCNGPAVEGDSIPGGIEMEFSPLCTKDGANRWADYSSASDSEIHRHHSTQAEHPAHHPTASRGRMILLPPLAHNSSARQRDHSPSRHRRGPKRFNPKVAARHDALGSCGGVVCCVARKWKVSDFRVLAPSFAVQFKASCAGFSINVVAIYTPNSPGARAELWQQLEDTPSLGPSILLGDFNNVEFAEDSLSASPLFQGEELVAFNSLSISKGLVDCYREGPPVLGPWYTRFQVSNEHFTASRLDRVYISDEGSWVNSIHSVTHWGGQNVLDHLPVQISLSVVGLRGLSLPPPLSYPNFILVADDFRAGLQSVWRPRSPLISVQENWDLNILAARRHIQSYVKSQQLQGHQLPILEAELAVLHSELAANPANSQLRAAVASKSSLIRHLAHHLARRAFMASGERWAAQGDLPSSFFFSRALRRRARSYISCIKAADGTMLHNPIDIADRFSDVYKTLYTREIPLATTLQAQSQLLHLTQTHNFSAADLAMLYELPSCLEISDVLQEMNAEVAPGPDGLSSNFFLSCWEVVGTDLAEMICDAWESFYLSANIRMAAIVPIPKSLALDAVEDWRPISLLNIICKLIAKIIACLLALLLGLVVAKQQGGFLKGRGTFANILQAQLAFAWAAHSKYRGLAVKIDFHKAYDRINHDFLIQVIAKLGFGDRLGKLVAMLYKDAPSHLRINGIPASPFTLGRGVRQGCPLAPLLYALSTQPLMESLQHRQGLGHLQGWPFPEALAPYYLLFADDLVVFIPDSPTIWCNLMAALQHFCLASGNRINWAKSQVKHSLRVAAPDWLSQHQCTCLGANEPLMYLGAPLGSGVSSNNFVDIWTKRATKMLLGWNAASLSMAGRAVLVRHCLSAVPEYLSSCGMPPGANLKEFIAILRTFFWGSKASGLPRSAQIAWDTLILPKLEGGLGLRNISHQVTKHNLKWLRSTAL
ncbi:unnamed protein product [Calypogeia fissa]